MARRTKHRIREERTFVVTTEGTAGDVVCGSSDEEVATLIGVAASDVTWLAFGVRSKMWMSRSQQIDKEAPVNRVASMSIAQGSNLAIAIRGPVVVHHERHDFSGAKTN